MSFEFRKGQELRKRFSRGHWSFTGPRDEEKLHGTHTYKPKGKWNITADDVVEKVKESGHPIFRGISTLNRGVLKRKSGRCTFHITAESQNAELLFRPITQQIS